MQGVIAAAPTPIDAEGRPVKAAFLEHCRWALANGCDGLNILGSTGEANSFDSAARIEVMSWAAEALDLSRLMVGTGTPALGETIRLTLEADRLGYSIALVLPPYYYKPVSEAGLIAWYLAVHEALGARKIQIWFYNYPQMTGLTIPVTVVAELYRRHPERFGGIKDSSGNLDYCRDLVARAPGLKVFPSSETSLGEAAASGFAGCISATANITAPLCGRLWADRESPDPETLARAGAIRTAIASEPLIPSVKAQVAARSGDTGWLRVLPPFLPLDTEARARVTAQLGEPVIAV